jgi:N-acetyl-alpha-D-muramate 1-phosphate uridylyltransferase
MIMQKIQPSTAMILAAGLGTRLGSITQLVPKALVEVNGEPLLKRVIMNLKMAGFTKIAINVHHFANEIIDYVTKNEGFGIDILFSDETHNLLDTGGGILKAMPLFGKAESVLIHNVDVITNIDLRAFSNTFEQSGAAASLAVRTRESSRSLIFDGQLQLAGWRNHKSGEEKWVATPLTKYLSLAFSGIHIIKPKFFVHLPVAQCSVIDLYLKLANDQKVTGYLHDEGYWFDLGKAEQLPKIIEFLKTEDL